MRKLPLLLLALLGTCAATCAAQEPHALTELQGTARVLMVFAPDSSSASYKRQLELIEHHAFELAQRNTVVVPASLVANNTEDFFPGENLPFATPTEQADIRTKFHILPGDFVVILITQDGAVRIRSASPVDIHSLTASLDALPRH
jgi:uncharacterized protein DUF4174